MAYGNWGAFVYRNGERQPNREDQTPYRETELEAGYIQAFGVGDGLGPHHAVLGSGRFRLCGYKSSPMAYLDGAKVDLSPFKVLDEEADEDRPEYHGVIEGWTFVAVPFNDPEGIKLTLIEPDGTKWTSRCGYCIGAGHEDRP